MTELEKAQRRIKQLLYLAECRDFVRREGRPISPAVNTLLPDDAEEEPFFIVHEIDWNKYGRDDSWYARQGIKKP